MKLEMTRKYRNREKTGEDAEDNDKEPWLEKEKKNARRVRKTKEKKGIVKNKKS